MIDDRFSAQAFESAGLNSDEARRLADELAAAIQNELHVAILPAIGMIAARLNALGHALQFYYPPTPGEIAYRDDAGEGKSYSCRLRVAVDTVISTGYSHTEDASAELEDSNE